MMPSSLIYQAHLFKKAKNSNADSIIAWGDGTATRDFLFVDDAAEGLILASGKASCKRFFDLSVLRILGSPKSISPYLGSLACTN